MNGYIDKLRNMRKGITCSVTYYSMNNNGVSRAAPGIAESGKYVRHFYTINQRTSLSPPLPTRAQKRPKGPKTIKKKNSLMISKCCSPTLFIICRMSDQAGHTLSTNHSQASIAIDYSHWRNLHLYHCTQCLK